MPRPGPKKVQRYSLEFKLKAVKLSQLKGVEVQSVVDALEIHPFMLSRWRKEARKNVDSWEFYFLLEGVGHMRIGARTVAVPRCGSALVAPHMLRQVFNDTAEDALWLIVGAPQEGRDGAPVDPSKFYPEDPKSLPPELAGRVWPLKV